MPRSTSPSSKPLASAWWTRTASRSSRSKRARTSRPGRGPRNNEYMYGTADIPAVRADVAQDSLVRLRLGVSMAPKGGRTAVIGVEVREKTGKNGRLEHSFHVGLVERVSPPSVGAAAERVAELVAAMAELRPCVLVD